MSNKQALVVTDANGVVQSVFVTDKPIEGTKLASIQATAAAFNMRVHKKTTRQLKDAEELRAIILNENDLGSEEVENILRERMAQRAEEE